MSDHERKLLREAELVACKPRHVQRAFEALIPELRLPLMCVHQRGKLSIKHGRKIVVPIIQGGGNVLLFPNKLEISCGNMNECGANVVHPWVEVTMRADFDLATCRTSWEVLVASVDDLLSSYP